MKHEKGYGRDSVIFFTETHKECSSCKEVKLHSEFHKDKSNKYQLAYYCKPCANQKSKEFYKQQSPEHREKLSVQGRKRRIETKQKAVEFMGNCCADCKKQFPLCVYDFHHLHPDEKDFHIGDKKVWGEILQKELTKCVLLCANCHRIRHFEGGYLYASID